ncbi:MAG: hypothetical protein Q9213_006301 [Squamulea squamosa]
MSVGTIIRTITETKSPKFFIPPFFNPPGTGPNWNSEDVPSHGPVPTMPEPSGPEPGGPGGFPNPDPVPGGDQPKIDWDKIFDPGADPLLSDPLEEWSCLFQGWCVYTGHFLKQLGQKASTTQIVKYQAPWLAYVITTFPRYTLSVKRLQNYLDEWNAVSGVISFGLKPPEAFSSTDINSFEDFKTLLAKLTEQLKKFPNCRWTGFMTGGVGTNPSVGTEGQGITKGGLKPGPSSHGGSGGGSGSGQSDDDDEDFNPGDSADNRPDQDQSRQRQWEELFHAWRLDFITYLNAIRANGNENQLQQIHFLIGQLHTGPPSGSNQAQINATLTTWSHAAQLIRDLTQFDLLPVANMDRRLDVILRDDLEILRHRLRGLVAAFPNYQWLGDH